MDEDHWTGRGGRETTSWLEAKVRDAHNDGGCEIAAEIWVHHCSTAFPFDSRVLPAVSNACAQRGSGGASAAAEPQSGAGVHMCMCPWRGQ